MSLSGVLIITAAWVAFCSVVVGPDGIGFGAATAAASWALGAVIWAAVRPHTG